MNVKPLILLVCLSAADAAAQDNAEKGPAAATPIAFQVLETQQVDLGNRSIFYHRVVPPNLPQPPPPVPLAPPLLTPEEEAAQFQWEQKEHKFIFLSATVYDRRLTELRWNDETREYRAFSNIDFNYFTGFSDFQTQTASYFFFLGIGNESNAAFNRLLAEGSLSARVKQALRDLAQLPQSRPSYVLVEEKPVSPQNKNAPVDLDALHLHYAANWQKMQENFRRQEAENAERERWLREHPPLPKDTVIHFWPKKNSRYLSSQEEGPK